MRTTALEKSFTSLKRHLSEYLPQLEKALPLAQQSCSSPLNNLKPLIQIQKNSAKRLPICTLLRPF